MSFTSTGSMNPVNIRLLSQQLVCPQFSSPTEMVSYMGAIQAQDYRMMRWAVAIRLKKANEKAFREAYNSGKIVRTHLHRCTWQLMAGEDYYWMMDLCSSKALSCLKGWMHANKIFIEEEEKNSMREILLKVVHEKRSATKEDITKGFQQAGIEMDDHRISYHIRLAELDGVLCSGDLLPMKPSYSISEEKLGPRPMPLSKDEMLIRMTRKYFQSRCPATLEDYLWWSGLNISDCKRGVELLGEELDKESYKGREFFLYKGYRTRGCRKGTDILLPPYDEYLIGYKSRDIVLSEEFRPQAHNNSGIFYPVVAKDGIVCENWSPLKNDDVKKICL